VTLRWGVPPGFSVCTLLRFKSPDPLLQFHPHLA
jgi:hypothetical protein